MRTYDLNGFITAIQPLATCSKDLKDRKGQENQPIPVPSTQLATGTHLYFPATGIRGRIRRAARDLVRSRVIGLTGNDKPFSLDQHYFLTLGGIKGAGDQDRSTVAMEQEWRNRNPLLSVFGAGDAGVLGFVQGRLGIGNAICEEPCQSTIFSGARTDDLYRDKDQVRYLSDGDLDALIMRSKGNKSRSELAAQLKIIEREQKKAKGNQEKLEELKVKAEALAKQIAANKENTGAADVSVGMPLAGWQAIPQGQRMNHRMILARSSEVELGFLLQALSQFALLPVLGAHYANGCGLVSGRWEVAEVSETGRKTLGLIEFDAMYPAEITGEPLLESVNKFNEWFASGGADFSIPHAEV